MRTTAQKHGLDVGDLVVSKQGHWNIPRLVITVHQSAKALVGVLFEDEIKYIHYKHLKIVGERGII